MTNFISINPYTEKVNKEFTKTANTILKDNVAHADAAQQSWKQISFTERGELFLRLSELIKQHKEELAKVAVMEMGKPYNEALAEVMKCTTACEYYGNEAERILQSEHSTTDLGKQVEIVYEPLGLVLGIFPWNFPYWQIIRSAVPVLMAGNAMLVKPAPNAPKCALAMQHLFELAGFPNGIVQTIFADEEQISTLIKDDRIKACTLTGSEKAGASVASQAALQIKKSVLELGGSDPFIVLEDADLDKAAETAITARFQNNGQSCIASKRFIIHENISETFLKKLTDRIADLKLGDPMDPTVNMGPMARKDLRDKLKQQVDDSIVAGAKIIYQHPFESLHGFFFPPTVLTHIPENAPAFSEELFGPVISVFVVKDEPEAVRIANATTFGLGSCVWTQNIETGKRIAAQLECGQVFINGLVKSHTRYPFGGSKRSGFGRELGEWGIREFCNVKTIWI